jgi:hydrogenase expression/formation protein HypE
MIASKIVTLDYGEGGLKTQEFIFQEILKRFNNPILAKLDDGSVIDIHHKKFVITTDSFIVDPPIFPGGNIGKLAVTGTVNDLVACGSKPIYLTLSLIIPEGFSFSNLEIILDSLNETAKLSNIIIVCGDTKVVPQRDSSVLCVNTTGLGEPINKNDYSTHNAKPGDKIIITGEVANHSLAILSIREGLGFENKIFSDCSNLDDLILPLLKRFDKINCLRDPTRGGLLGVLFDIIENSKVNAIINFGKIPVQKEVNFGCEMLGLDPLSLVNEGKMVIVVNKEQADDVLIELKKNIKAEKAAIIGEIQETRNVDLPQLILKKDEKNLLLKRPTGRTIPRLC